MTEEFEIDPKQNNGLNYQYHDVQRGRAERKQMHGGDCECCNGVDMSLFLDVNRTLMWCSITKRLAHCPNTMLDQLGKILLSRKGRI